MTEPVIRPARPEEVAAVGQLTAAIYLAAGHISASDPYLDELRDSARRAEHALLLVAELDGAVVGTVTLARAGSPLAEVSRPGEAELRMLAVSPAVQGRGVGTALVRDCAQRARADGCTAMVLCTQERMREAGRIYARMGFAPAPDRDWSPHPGVHLKAYRLEVAPA